MTAMLVIVAVCAVVGIVLAVAYGLVRHADAKRAMRLFGFSISYLTALFAMMGIDAIIIHP